MKALIVGAASGVVTYFASIHSLGYTLAIAMPRDFPVALWDAVVFLGLGATLVAFAVQLIAIRVTAAPAAPALIGFGVAATAALALTGQLGLGYRALLAWLVGAALASALQHWWRSRSSASRTPLRGASPPPQDTGRVRAIIARHNADLARWYATGDVDSVASVFAEDAWQMPPNNPPLVGREAIHGFWHQATQWGKWEFDLDAVSVDACGAMAVERGRYALKFTAGAGAPPGMASFEDRGHYLVHWRHEADGEWRIVSDAPVSELPLGSPPDGR